MNFIESPPLNEIVLARICFAMAIALWALFTVVWAALLFLFREFDLYFGLFAGLGGIYTLGSFWVLGARFPSALLAMFGGVLSLLGWLAALPMLRFQNPEWLVGLGFLSFVWVRSVFAVYRAEKARGLNSKGH